MIKKSFGAAPLIPSFLTSCSSLQSGDKVGIAWLQTSWTPRRRTTRRVPTLPCRFLIQGPSHMSDPAQPQCFPSPPTLPSERASLREQYPTLIVSVCKITRNALGRGVGSPFLKEGSEWERAAATRPSPRS